MAKKEENQNPVGFYIEMFDSMGATLGIIHGSQNGDIVCEIGMRLIKKNLISFFTTYWTAKATWDFEYECGTKIEKGKILWYALQYLESKDA